LRFAAAAAPWRVSGSAPSGLPYYTVVSRVLDVFNVPLPEGASAYFAEPK
jgi:hypothetical protein